STTPRDPLSLHDALPISRACWSAALASRASNWKAPTASWCNKAATMPGATSLTDGHGRRIDYLRVSVTDRCDLRCTYCLPAGFKDFDAPAHWLTHAEMARLVGVFVGLGVRKLRLT